MANEALLRGQYGAKLQERGGTEMGRATMPFEERVMFVVRGLVEYGRHGGDEARAAKVVRKHFPGMSLAACAATVRINVAAYRDGIEFVATHQPAYDELRERLPAPPTAEFEAMEKTFLDEHPDIPRKLMHSVLFFIHDWHHVR